MKFTQCYSTSYKCHVVLWDIRCCDAIVPTTTEHAFHSCPVSMVITLQNELYVELLTQWKVMCITHSRVRVRHLIVDVKSPTGCHSDLKYLRTET